MGRNRANWIAGWLLSVGLLVMMVLVVDPLNVQGRPENEIGFGAFGLSSVVVAFVVSAMAMRLFAIPAVFAVDEILLVRNPMREWAIPIHMIKGTDDSLTYVRVHAGDRKIVCIALEKSNVGLLAGSHKMDARLERVVASQTMADPTVRARVYPAPTGEVRWKWVPIQRSERVVFALWIAYVIAGALRHYF